MTKSIVLASSNAGKLQEMSDLLEQFSVKLIRQSDLGVTDAEETGLTFIENAILKARHAAEATRLPAIADDSGLEVDALDGAPGIYSARFSKMNGRDGGDAENNRLLLEKLDGLPQAQRTARFRSVIVLMKHANDPSPIIAEGVWQGSILTSPSGENGFGYDPLFLAPETGSSAATLSKSDKNALSHRGKALRQLLASLEQIKQTGENFLDQVPVS